MGTAGVDVGSCPLCQYLYEIFRQRKIEEWNICMEGSALIHNKKRILTLRSSADTTYDNIQVGHATLPKVSSTDYFTLLCAWLRRCDQDHLCTSQITKDNLPTRVVDIGEAWNDTLVLRDVTEIDVCSYVVLSHCWGKYELGDKKRICTHKDNFKQRQKGFQAQDLPKTFQDAVDVTRELGKRYLWIDSLCIVQSVDEKETADWKQESKRMETVFSSAYCTLAASSARGSDEGFLKLRPDSLPLQIQIKDGRRLYISTEIDDFFGDVEHSLLNDRGWVLQERVLSRRTIYFSAKHTYFECGEGVSCENFTFMKSPIRKEYFSMDPQFPDRLLKSGRARTLEFIHHLFQDFSQRHLTNATDRSVALSGLESRISNAIRTKSIYGILEKFLHETLLWQRPENGELNRIDYGKMPVPSWSWMAYSGPVEFPISFTTRMDFRTGLYLEGDEKKALSAPEVAMFKDCEVEGETATIFKKGMRRAVGRIRYDRIGDTSEFNLQRCIVLGRKSEAKGTYYILVVTKDEYLRVGIGEIESSFLSRIEGRVCIR